MNWKFTTFKDLLDRQAEYLAAANDGERGGEGAGDSSAEAGAGLPDFLMARESFYSGKPVAELRSELARRIRVTRSALDRGVQEAQHSFSGMTKGGAVALAGSQAWPVDDEFFRKALTYALAVNEVNACGGRIIAFPTAGSCGIVPGVLWAWRDVRAPDLGPDTPAFQDAFIMASAVGILIATRATLAGAAGGCQAECGAAGAMAAAGLATLLGEGPVAAFDAAALSLKNSLGLACDPVAGLVEVPCTKRNAFLAANAITAVSFTRAGITSVIPFDEVVGAMKAIGDSMPQSIRESAEGGLAKTATGLSYWDKIR
jgi:L-serine dehydratase